MRKGKRAESQVKLVGGGDERVWDCGIVVFLNVYERFGIIETRSPNRPSFNRILRSFVESFFESSNHSSNCSSHRQLVLQIVIRIVQSFIQLFLASPTRFANRSQSRSVNHPIVFRIAKLVNHKHVMFKMNALFDLADDVTGELKGPLKFICWK